MPHSVLGPTVQHLHRPRRPERALAIALLAAVLFLEPFLGIFGKGGTTMVWGIPLLYVYLFAAWSLIILLTTIVMENRAELSERNPDEEPTGSGAASGDADPREALARSNPE